MNNRYSQHFTVQELECPSTKVIKLEPGFISDLEELRMLFDEPMIVTSCCRSLVHNQKIGGHPRSLHMFNNTFYGTDTCAIDIKRPNSLQLHVLISCAVALEWSVGIADTFIHLDMRSKYTSLLPSVYTY